MGKYLNKKIEKALILHALKEWTNKEIVLFFKDKNIRIDLDGILNSQEINRLYTAINNEEDAVSIIASSIQELLGKYVDLKEFENNLNQFYIKKKIVFEDIKKIESVVCYLGGDIVVKYYDSNQLFNTITLVSDTDTSLRPINLLNINGGLYYNGVCIPISTNLIQQIVGLLANYSDRKWNPYLVQIIDFLESGRYFRFGENIGRL